MALNAYMKCTGETQGEIKGSVTQAGREDSMMIIAFNHEIRSPRDAASGQATGKREHLPVTVTKELDKATPLYLNVLVNNENLTTWELRFWRPAATGVEEQYYTIELTNSTVSQVRTEMLNNKYPENMQHREREHVSFTYQKITWTWEDGGITAQDDWETPIV